MPLPCINSDQVKQQTQMMQMRGAQMAQNINGQQTSLGSQPRAKGTKKQLVSTIVGIAAVFVVLILLKVLNII